MMEKALEIAQGMETADHDTKTMKNSALTTPTVLHLPTKSNSVKRPCYGCGRYNHNEKECHFKEP